MSRLHDVMENHERLDDLMAIIKHHGVNAAFVTTALLQSLETDEKEEETEMDCGLLIEDLQQFQSQF